MSRKVKQARRPHGTRSVSRSLLCSASLAATVMALGTSRALHAEDRHWDPNATSVGIGGTGIWNLGNLFWTPNPDGVSGPYVAPWNNDALDNAIFGGTAGTVTLGEPVVVHNLTFNVAGYVLSGSSLTLAGDTPTITSTSGSTVINSVVGGSQGLTKAGGGTLQLAGANTFSGTISILAGSLHAPTDAGLGALSNNILTAAGASVTLRIDGAETARAVTIGDGGTLTLSGAGVGGARISGNGNVNVAASNNPVTIVHLTNDSSNYTGSTRFNGCNGVCSVYFTSIGNLGEESSLGAPTDETTGTILFQQQSQYTDQVIYVGDGDSSNRNWDINGSGAVIRNLGTGTLSITGNVDISASGSFNAETADIALLGVLSGGSYGFNSLNGNSITLGDANTFSGSARLSGLVRASVLADVGAVSSLGVGSSIEVNVGTLSYIGTGDDSDRSWTISGVSRILNDGTGALNLGGATAFSPGAPDPDSLTLGGSYAGVNSFSGVISGAGNLVSDGAGTWVLDGANSFTGSVTVENGTLRAGSAAAFGNATGFVVNGGELDLDGHDLTARSLNGTGGTITLGGGTLTVNATGDGNSYAGSITGTGGLTKAGAGTLTLAGASSYTGATTLGGGTLALDFSGAGGPAANIISASSALIVSGGTLDVIGATGEGNGQSFSSMTVTAGSTTVQAGGGVNLALGTITRTGGLVDFVLAGVDPGRITTDNMDNALGGWATINGTDYAKVVGGEIVAFDETDYTSKDDAGTWADNEVISDTDGDPDSPFFGIVAGDIQLGGLRYTAAADSDVVIAAGVTLGVDGTIIVAPSAGAANQSITGGFVTGGPGGGTLGVQQNSAGMLTIGSTIVDNGVGTSFSKGGDGRVRLTGSNSYSGGTTVSGGTLEVTTLADGGSASSIGASSADPANLVLESGTLAYVSGADAVSDRGFTLVNGGGDRTIEIASGGANLTFTGQVTSPDNAGLTKTGPGTLTLANTGNDYVGVTTVTGGTLAIGTIADGGTASSIGAASADPSNIVLAGGNLAYLGTTAGSDRGITLDAGGGGIDVTDADTTLSLSGIIAGPASLRKNGAGTLVLAGANTYVAGTSVNDGILRAGATNVFGGGAMAVSAGALLDLDGFNNAVGTLNGSGDIDLGSGTLTVNSGGTFTGTISGTGGFTRAGTNQFTLTLGGCSNDYTGVTSIVGVGLSVGCLADGGMASDIGASDGASGNLSFSGGGGTLVYTGGSVAIDRGFTLTNNNNTINVANAATALEFEGDAVGTGVLRKNGDGVLILSGDNSYSGGTTVLAGILRAGSNSAFGTGTVSMSNAAGATLDLADLDNMLRAIAGGGALGGNILLGTATLTLNGTGTGTTSYAGVIDGTGALVKAGTYTQELTGCANGYSGSTTINAGVLAVSCLADGGEGSSIGVSDSAAASLVINGGTLRYIGAGDSTDRQFTLGPAAGSVLDASGTGAINFTSIVPIIFSGTNTAQTLTLTGTNTGNNILAAQITNNGTGLTSLTKAGTGTWILTNQDSSYTGITRINGGVLGVDKLANGGVASSIGASSAAAANLVIGNGSTLRYTGAGDTTNRLFTLSAGVTFIESSGTGAIVFTDTGAVTLQGANQMRTIALGGTNTGNNTLAGSIGNAGTGITTLAKNDSGTWVLTGNHSYTGTTNINDGLLSIGGGGTTGSIASAIVNNFGTLAFNRSDSLTYGGMIVGTGGLRQIGAGTTILTGDSSYTGGTTIADGTLRLGDGGTTGSIVGNVANGGLLVFDRSNAYAFSGVISGSGAVTQDGTGTTTLSGVNSYAGGTTINAGILQVSSDANLGAAAGTLTFDGGTLQTTASMASARGTTLESMGTVLTNTGTDFRLSGAIAGAGSLTKAGLGRLILMADNSYAGGTTIAAGVLQLGDGGASGAISGDVTDNGSLVFFRSDDIGFDGLISGTGSVVKNGAGTLTLTADNGYGGATTVNAGALRINGDQSAATGLVAVSSGATLGGSGTIGGTVNVVGGGILAPGNSPGTLTIGGDLLLSAGSLLNFEFGEADVAGGPLNDLVNVGGNLRLDGTINVTVSAGGTFGGGIYRVFNYDGTLIDNGLVLGAMPGGSNVIVQTSVAGQVNLVNSTGLALSFWDGDAGPGFNGIIDGGNGTWHLGGTDNKWTDAAGSVNAAYADGSFAVFAGTGGIVAVDNGDGAVTASGLQFASDGYLLTGDALTLTDPQSEIRVGDGTGTGAAFTTTIAAELTGDAQLVKIDLGTLILTGANSYTGGTAINGGTLQVSSDANLGDAAGALSFDDGTLVTTLSFGSNRNVSLAGAGTIVTSGGTVLTLDGAISGAGNLVKAGGGTLVLSGASDYAGGTTVVGGAVQISDDANLGAVAGTLSLQGGVLRAGASFASSRNILVGSPTSNSIDTQAFDVTLNGTIGDGPGNAGGNFLNKLGAGTLTLTGNNIYSNRTVIAGGTLALAGTGTIGAANLVVGSGTVFDISQTDTGARVIQLNGAADGTIALGSKTLTLGLTASFTDWLGTIIDGGIGGGTGGSVVIVAPDGAVRYFNATSYTGGTTVAAGSFELAGGGALYSGGAVAVNAGASFSIGNLTAAGTTIGDLSGGGVVALGTKALTLGTANSTTFSGTITGVGGSITKDGTGTFTLTGANNYTGGTIVNAGTLLVNGDQSAATGLTIVNVGGTLGGVGTIGGNVIMDGGLNPGDLGTAPGTLTIAGNLVMGASSTFSVDLGQANVVGGPFNDLVNVGGDLVLGGTLDVETAPGDSFDPGIYRLISYAGALTDNGLAIGTIPSPDFYVQTSVANQVNLVNTTGLQFRFWDGPDSKNDGVIDGGDGLWQNSTGNDNWVDEGSIPNAPFADDAFAVFMGASGLVTVDNSLGGVTAGGMQFATDGYVIDGDALTLVGAQSIIRVGDGTGDGANYTATIAAAMTGAGDLVKTDLGTLVLTGSSSFAGDVYARAGELRISGGGTLHNMNGLVGPYAGEQAIVTVTGTGSSWTNSDELWVGYDGTGTLNIADGGRVTSNSGSLGMTDGALGQVLVTGAGSSWENAGRISVGAGGAGAGDLRIEDGGMISSNDGIVGASAQGDAVITGAGSSWVNLAQFTVGSFGAGTLRIEDGGNVTSNQGYIGANADGNVTVTGTGSSWLVTDFALTIGNSANGALSIEDGGLVRAEGGVFLGMGPGTSGTLAIRGTAGNAAILETSGLLGGLGTADVTLDGGLLRATADNDVFFDGFGAQDVTLGANGGVIDTDGHDIGISPRFVGAGGLIKDGAGTLILTGASSYAGATNVNAGTLFVEGDQTAATGLTTVSSGATLGGTGIIGGGVMVADGATLTPGSNGVGTLTINDGLSLGAGSILDFEFGQANMPGGALNDLVDVGGDLVLDGTLNVSETAGGSFGPGIYRVLNYGGALTNNGLDLGTLPAGADVSVQTSIAGQVNLVNTAGLTLSFWDGAAGPKNDGAVNGGDGVWRIADGAGNWTDMDGVVNGDYAQDSFAIFSAAPGLVTVDNGGGDVLASGMQFASDGYVIGGDALTLTGANTIVQVGDGSAAGAGYTATIDAELTGTAGLRKTDAGTLVLTAVNSYAGGTTIDDGVLAISSDANLGDAVGNLTFNGGTLNTRAGILSGRTIVLDGAATFLTDANTTLALGGAITGTGSLAKAGAGTLLILSNSSHSGATTISAGRLQLGNGGTAGAISGNVANAGILAFDRSDDVTFGGIVSGSGALEQLGAGTLVLTADNSYAGGTTIASGRLQLGDGGASGAITGDVLDNGALAFDRADDIIFAGLISGSGSLEQIGDGTTILTGANSYAGVTSVNAGTLLVNGDQSAATGLTSVAPGATLGGTGTIGGDVAIADGGRLAPGDGGPGALAVNGGLALAPGARLAYQFGQVNDPGSPLNDVVNVGGDLILDGTIDIAVTPDGSFDIGLYRVINYGGTLTDDGLVIGAAPADSALLVQTSIAHQVNLINAGSALLNIWDGAVGPKFDGVINGGDGIWQNGLGNDNWADASGAVNAAYDDGAFAIFSADAGTVTVDNGLGAVTASGMQFASDGYALAGDALTLTSTQAVVRVGDGTAAGEAYIATIGAELAGTAGLVKTDLGTLILSGANSYAGGTAINGGTLQVADDANLGAATGGLSLDNGTLHSTADLSSDRAVELAGTGTFLTDASTALVLAGTITGDGSLAKSGAGTLVLAGMGSHAGGTDVLAGSLFVNGDFAGATGLTRIGAGATLGGTGTIGGDVTLADGATLDPGMNGPGTLTINGGLNLSSGSQLSFELGQANVAGGALNDLVNVGGDLVLDGTINVSEPIGGTFDAGVYRLFNYGGTLTDNGLSLGTLPAGGDAVVQTSVAGQVNLVNSAGLTLNFWDGAAGPKNDGAVNGGDGVWQNSSGNDSWTDATGQVNAAYADGAFAIFSGAGGTVTVDDGLGAVTAGGMQFAVDGYTITGDGIALAGPSATIRVGDGSAAGADYVATIEATLTGDGRLVKTDAGTLVLRGINSYTGGTAINGGTLAISADANLGAAEGDVSLNGGTLATEADLSSSRDIVLTSAGTILTAGGTTFSYGGLLSGTGDLTKAGTGSLLLTGDSRDYVAAVTVVQGTLAVEGSLGGAVSVHAGARLEGTGTVGAIDNAGIVAAGRGGFGTLTVAGDYAGHGGRLEIETALGDDASPTDRLVVGGGTSGSTQVSVINRGGLGAQTVEGIKIIDVAGASDGRFVLDGDYVFDGDQAMIAGAYGYRLYQGGVAAPEDGDWYLRSSLLDPGEPGEPNEPGEPSEPNPPLYQPGVPIYEAYGANLQALNGLSTLQQRVGNRSWAAGANPEGSGIWGRMEGTRSRANAVISTSLTDQDVNSWKMQLGADQVLAGTAQGERLVIGLTGYYGQANSHIRSIFGNGSLRTDGYGIGGTLTWYGLQGFYVDGQAQFSWYDSDLESDILGRLARGNDGSGEAFSLEVGKRTSVGGKLSVTPQMQMVYSNVRFDRFVDPAGAVVAVGRGDSLKSRGGISIDHQNEWAGGRSHVYGVVNLSYEWLDGTRINVSGTPVDHANERLWSELGLGGSLSWTSGVTLYGEVSGNSPLRDFGDSYMLKANVGVRIAF